MAQTSTEPSNYSTSTGLSGDPYFISSLNNLSWLSQTSGEWGNYFKQTDDIDASGTSTWNTDGSGGYYGFSPIGTAAVKFTGHYDGDNHTISSLYINRPATTDIGFFGYVYNAATINNLGIINCNITGNDKTGGLVGHMETDVTVNNCYSTGTVSGNSQNIGGLVGYAYISCTISYSYSTASVASPNERVGGLVGYAGDLNISDCYSTGTVNGSSYVGGLVGRHGGNSPPNTISNCYNTGAVSGTVTRVGGLMGKSSNLTISNCYNTGAVSGTNSRIGGLVGNNVSSTVTDSFWDKVTSGQTTSAGGGTGKTTAEMKTQTTFTNWDFTNGWQILSGGSSYPYLQDPEQSPPPGQTSTTLTWDGSTDTDWNTPANWDGDAVPTSIDAAIIANVANQPVIVSGVGANCNDLTVNDAATLTINSGGSLITNGTITNNGTVDVKREISDGEWHLISSPNNVATANVFDGEYLQTWDESTATWAYITEPTTALTKVKGYSLWGIAKSTTHTFTGTPNTGDQSIATTVGGSGGTNNRANLVGNPYPSSLDWSALDDTWGAVNYWNGTAYVSWNDGTGSGSQYIPPMQGFFIVPSSSGTFSLTNSNRTHTGATSFYKSSNSIANGIVLAASNGWYSDEWHLRFDEESSENFEFQHDAYKFLSSTDGLSQLYSFTGDDMLSIDVRPACNVIQLGFQNNTDGNYSIDIVEMDGMTTVSLEDTKTNTMHNFTDGAYNFDYSITDAQTRFKLHLQTAGIIELSNNLLNIYANGNSIYVKSEQTIKTGSVKVCDITGRVVAQQIISNSNYVNIPANFNIGMYIVVVETEVGISSEKVIIK